ncbi:Uncharacterized protein HZ326_29242 [Fusarium oxysporum f. sp. albedinis]|nr:Uncharacterized protein HZ326_29242 [Fusarium oxysporum f. sp. albedinis]
MGSTSLIAILFLLRYSLSEITIYNRYLGISHKRGASAKYLLTATIPLSLRVVLCRVVSCRRAAERQTHYSGGQ